MRRDGDDQQGRGEVGAEGAAVEGAARGRGRGGASIVVRFFRWLLSLFLHFGTETYDCGRGKYIRVYSAHELESNHRLRARVVAELQDISTHTVGRIAPYPAFHGRELDNKLVSICYNRAHEPVATNVSFRFDTGAGTTVHHIGLFLVRPDYQKQGIQKALSLYTIVYYFLHARAQALFFTDLGRSASGFRGLDRNTVCFPTLRNTSYPTAFVETAKDIAEHLFLHHARTSCAVSMGATYDRETMVVSGSNDNDGFNELVTTGSKSGGKVSRSGKYNDYVQQICPSPADEFIIVFKVTLPLILKGLFSVGLLDRFK